MPRSSELHTFPGGLTARPSGHLSRTGAMSGQWGCRAAVGLTGLLLCLPPGASGQVRVPEVAVPPVLPQPLPPLPPLPSPPVPVPVPAAPVAPPIPPAPVLPSLPAPVLPGPSGATAASAPAADPGAIVERAAEAVWSSGGASAAAAAGGPDGGTAGDRAEARAERRAKRARARQVRRRLRRALKRHGECRFLLTTRERRILRLHLGLGETEARSRRAVARRLDTSTGRVRRAERRAVRKLRRADRSGICESPGLTTVSVSLAGSGPDAALAAALGAAGEAGAAGRSGAAPDGGVLGERRSGGRGAGSPDAADDERGGISVGGYKLADPGGGLTTLAWIALLATAVALLAGVLQLWQRGVLGVPDWLKRSGGPGR
jgi:sigma-70-like protein